MPGNLPALCGVDACRRIAGHTGRHSECPTEAWGFFSEKDKQKLVKAGFATPRGGRKGAYQNHVVRSNQVIIPYERLADVDLALYGDGYVVRVLPEQYFEQPQKPRPAFLQADSPVRIGVNAFVLYRSHESFGKYPPLEGWRVRRLVKGGENVRERGPGVRDEGEYVLRLPTLGQRQRREEGPPQGLFATEYSDEGTNFVCKCVLAWLTIQTTGSPYTLTQGPHLRSVLASEGLDDVAQFEARNIVRHGLCCCPLCMRFIKYEELHKIVSFEDACGLENAAMQVEGATRSTIVNLFHLEPLVYQSLVHVPRNVAWGHAVCNTRLGQRRCYSLAEIMAMNRKVGIVREEGIETFGWMSDDDQMIRSPKGAVWIQLNGDFEEEGAAGPPPEPGVFDAATNGAVAQGNGESWGGGNGAPGRV
jgi:hypothetical protein